MGVSGPEVNADGTAATACTAVGAASRRQTHGTAAVLVDTAIGERLRDDLDETHAFAGPSLDASTTEHLGQDEDPWPGMSRPKYVHQRSWPAVTVRSELIGDIAEVALPGLTLPVESV